MAFVRSLRRTEADPSNINSAIRDLQSFARPSLATITKNANETTASDITYSADSVLLFPVAASTKYRFRFVIYYDTPAAADFKYYIDGPAAPTLILMRHEILPPGAAAYTISLHTAFASATVVTETAGTQGCIKIEGVLQNGANAGNVTFTWAQNTSNVSNTTVYAGSYLEYAALP